MKGRAYLFLLLGLSSAGKRLSCRRRPRPAEASANVPEMRQLESRDSSSHEAPARRSITPRSSLLSIGAELLAHLPAATSAQIGLLRTIEDAVAERRRGIELQCEPTFRAVVVRGATSAGEGRVIIVRKRDDDASSSASAAEPSARRERVRRVGVWCAAADAPTAATNALMTAADEPTTAAGAPTIAKAS